MQLTNEQFLTTLAKVVNSKPAGFRYVDAPMTPHQTSACVRYSYDSCIVGEVLGEVAPDIRADLLVQETRHNASLGMSYIVEGNLHSAPALRISRQFRRNFTEAQIRVLRWAQWMQDGGTPWVGILTLAPGKLADAERGIDPITGDTHPAQPAPLLDVATAANLPLEDVVHHEAEIHIPMVDSIAFMSKVLSPEPIFGPVKIKEIVEA